MGLLKTHPRAKTKYWTRIFDGHGEGFTSSAGLVRL